MSRSRWASGTRTVAGGSPAALPSMTSKPWSATSSRARTRRRPWAAGSTRSSAASPGPVKSSWPTGFASSSSGFDVARSIACTSSGSRRRRSRYDPLRALGLDRVAGRECVAGHGWDDQDGHTVPAVKLYLSRPDQLLLAAGLGLTATTVLAGAILGGETSTHIGLVIALAVAGGIVLIVGQLIPRAIGRRWAKTLVPVVVPSLQAVAVLTAPLLWLARAARAGVERPRDVVKDV